MDSWDQPSYGNNTSYGSQSQNSFNTSHGNSGNSAGTKPLVQTVAQLEIKGLAAEVDCNVIRGIFGRYGRVSRIVIDHRFEEKKAFCYLDYETELSCDHAIRIENNRKIDGRTITVQKKTNNESSDKGTKRQRTEGWGNDSTTTSGGDDWGSTPKTDSGWGESNGRSGGRGGGGGGGGGGCRRCGEEGHFARECPKGGDSGGRGRGGRGGRGGGRACFGCGEEGHMSWDCPKKDSSGGGRGRGGGRGGRGRGGGSSWSGGGGSSSWGNDKSGGADDWATVDWGTTDSSSKPKVDDDWGTTTSTPTPAKAADDDWGTSTTTTTKPAPAAEVDWSSLLQNKNDNKASAPKKVEADDDGWN